MLPPLCLAVGTPANEPRTVTVVLQFEPASNPARKAHTKGMARVYAQEFSGFTKNNKKRIRGLVTHLWRQFTNANVAANLGTVPKETWDTEISWWDFSKAVARLCQWRNTPGGSGIRIGGGRWIPAMQSLAQKMTGENGAQTLTWTFSMR